MDKISPKYQMRIIQNINDKLLLLLMDGQITIE